MSFSLIRQCHFLLTRNWNWNVSTLLNYIVTWLRHARHDKCRVQFRRHRTAGHFTPLKLWQKQTSSRLLNHFMKPLLLSASVSAWVSVLLAFCGSWGGYRYLSISPLWFHLTITSPVRVCIRGRDDNEKSWRCSARLSMGNCSTTRLWFYCRKPLSAPLTWLSEI